MAIIKDEQRPLHVLAPGHIIPVADMAALFAARGVKCTIFTTPVNAAVIRSAVDRATADAVTALPIDLAVVPFPDVGLPPGVESGPALNSEDDREKFFQAIRLLREPFDRFLSANPTDAVVSDSFFDWSADAAAEHGVARRSTASRGGARRPAAGVPRQQHVRARLYQQHAAPQPPGGRTRGPRRTRAGLPHRVEMRRSQMLDPRKRPDHWSFHQRVYAADQRSYGEVFNSFRDLEPGYLEHYTTALARRAWLVGPVALASKDVATRGANNGGLSPDADACLRWLDTRPAGSVVYVSFGTLSHFSPPERRELARGLDMSGKNFVWVIGAVEEDPEWMPDGFAELLARGERGLVVREWAPQMAILNHAAVGGFVTHCGWNSTLEAVSAGVAMVTWPRYADQFYNEKLVVELLEVGVGVGSTEYASKLEARRVIGGEVVAEAIGKVMGGGEEAEAIRERARVLGEKARRAVEKGGSSYDDVGRLMDELRARRSSVNV
ncbi:hypothetical protein HU200_036666 [Digitaria exilis]|uniref:Glycosyltransferase n=1 Tax=Digitaria exilis TaxID=1010633 RepID=A0A835EIB1_9POAL|nr:hypothetical protein HU200_036666 [Digitaria exilis]CAB3477724.1 unnamed protein product [Digitaria exilis]